MKRSMLYICFVFCAAGIVFANASVEGYWLGFDNKTGRPVMAWEIYREQDETLCGKMISAAGMTKETIAVNCRESYDAFPVRGKAANQLPFLGTPWLFGFRAESENCWTGGSVINPQNGSLYSARITHHAAGGRYSEETLEVRGYLLCFSKALTFKRCTFEQAAALK